MTPDEALQHDDARTHDTAFPHNDDAALSRDQPAPPGIPPASNTHSIFFGDDGLRAGWSLLIYIALFVAMLSAATVIAHKLHPVPRTPHTATQPGQSREISVRTSLINESVPFFIVLLATWIMARIERRPMGRYGLGGSTRRLPQFLAGLAWGVTFLSLLVLILKSTGLLVFDTRLLFGAGILRYGIVWLLSFLMVALFEEYLVRGYLQFTLARGLGGIYTALRAPNPATLGFWTSAILLSILFGLGHSSNPGESPIGLLSAGLAALVFCLSLWRTGSLWWAIGFHTTWDWAQSFLYGVADSGTMVQFHLFRTHSLGRPLISGGATGPEGSIYIVPVLALAAAAILITLPKAPSPDLQPPDLYPRRAG